MSFFVFSNNGASTETKSAAVDTDKITKRLTMTHKNIVIFFIKISAILKLLLSITCVVQLLQIVPVL